VLTPIFDQEDRFSFHPILVTKSHIETIIQEGFKNIIAYSDPPLFDNYEESDVEGHEQAILLCSRNFEQQFHEFGKPTFNSYGSIFQKSIEGDEEKALLLSIFRNGEFLIFNHESHEDSQLKQFVFRKNTQDPFSHENQIEECIVDHLENNLKFEYDTGRKGTCL
jgi:hypothetical protein